MEPKTTASGLWVAAASLYVYGKALCFGCYALGWMLCRQLTTPRWLFAHKPRRVDPKCLHDPAHGKHGYLTAQGLKFHYVEKGDRSKPLMLFLHGFPDFWYSWRYQMKEFSDDYWTVAVDMRGYGNSAKPASVWEYTPNVIAEDIKGFVTGLGRKNCILVGHDWGAIVSWIFLEKYPEMVDKYILMNGPTLKVFTQLCVSFSSNQSSKSWYTYLFQIPYLAEMYVSFGDFELMQNLLIGPKTSSLYISEQDLEAYKYVFSQPGSLTPPLNYYRAAYRTMIRQGLPLYSAVDVGGAPRPKGLFIFGAQDASLDVKCVIMLQTQIENLKTLVMEKGNCFVHQDEPVAVNKAMRSFLEMNEMRTTRQTFMTKI